MVRKCAACNCDEHCSTQSRAVVGAADEPPFNGFSQPVTAAVGDRLGSAAAADFHSQDCRMQLWNPPLFRHTHLISSSLRLLSSGHSCP
jgi:hypothetical protein